MRVDVWSDVACPWCFLGKRRLAAALAATGIDADVHWRAFELAPDLPPDGVDLEAFFRARYGGIEAIRPAQARLAALGREVGIDFAFERQTRAANTRLAHRAIQLARDLGGAALQDQVVEACFRGNFEEGLDLSDRDALVARLGVPALAAPLAEGDGEDAVAYDEALAARLQIRGVPYFLADERLGLSGAQAADVFVAFLERARAR